MSSRPLFLAASSNDFGTASNELQFLNESHMKTKSLLIEAPFKERHLPDNPENREVRAALQKVLDQHPAGKDSGGDAKAVKEGKPVARKKA